MWYSIDNKFLTIPHLMPHRLKQRQSKIQTKRKQTPRREFVMEIASWYSLGLYKRGKEICMFPDSVRRWNIVSNNSYKIPELLRSAPYKGNKSFFDLLARLFSSIDQPDRLYFGVWNENSEYANSCFGVKNAYLSFEAGMWSKNILYSNIVYNNCVDVVASQLITENCSVIYNCFNVTASSYIFSSKFIHNSSQVYWSTNLVWCSDCIGCDNMTNASFCYKNTSYSRDQYLQIKERYLRQTNLIDIYDNLLNQWIHIWSSNAIGSWLLNTHDVTNGYGLVNIKSWNNICFFQWWSSSTNIYDVFHGWIECHHIYWSVSIGENINHVYCSIQIAKSSFLYYCSNLEGCSYCLWCIWLKNKSYCIFNKQYTKEERYDKVDEVFAQMEIDGTLGNFFPWSMSPFYFNDTAAYLIDDSFTKEEVEAKGYLWRDEPITVDIPEGVQTVKVSELGKHEGWSSTSSDWQKDPTATPLDGDQERWIDPEIMKKVIVDEEGNAYRVIPMEYDFLMKHGLPLPRKHWLERIKQHFSI